MALGQTLDRLERAFLAVDRGAVDRLVAEALQEASPQRVIDGLLVPALVRIGTTWERGGAALSQVYMAGRMAETVTERLLPQAARPSGAPRVALGVLEDQHALGKRMVQAHLHAAAIPVLDLGAGLSPAAFADQAAGEGASVVLVSVLMLRSALSVGELVAGLRARGCAAPVVVGGAPFRLDPGLWARVGAAATGASAADAPALARRFGGAP